jgi:hypothetical protein
MKPKKTRRHLSLGQRAALEMNWGAGGGPSLFGEETYFASTVPQRKEPPVLPAPLPPSAKPAPKAKRPS